MQELVERLLLTSRGQSSREPQIQPRQGQGRAFCKEAVLCVIWPAASRSSNGSERKEMFPLASALHLRTINFQL